MNYRYAVLGAGRQGVASAYDLIRFGETDEVLLIDIDRSASDRGASHINKLLGKNTVRAVNADISKVNELKRILKGVDTIIAAVHYNMNLQLTEMAIEMKINMTDLGGNTGVVLGQLERTEAAKKAGISIIPDCGMGPGMNLSLAIYAMSLLEKPEEVLIWDGGLPQKPEPPWNYVPTFNLAGLTNEYYGKAFFLRQGEVVEVPCFDDYEILQFPESVGKLEAFVTSGGLSTAPWSFKGKLKRLENKTLRYIGHCAQFKSFSELGLLEEDEVIVDGIKIKPRDFFHVLLERKLKREKVKDICIIRVKCSGMLKSRKSEAVIELIDFYDENTEFTAMQRLTGWHASIMAIMATKNKISPGVNSVENALSGSKIIKEAKKRGFNINEKISVVN